MTILYFLYLLNDELKSFQNGVDTVYNGCITYGSTPIDKTPNSIVNAIEDIYNTRYNEGYKDGEINWTENFIFYHYSNRNQGNMPNPPAYQMDSNHDTAIIEIAGYSNHYSDWYVTNSDVTQIHHRYETGPKENDNG